MKKKGMEMDDVQASAHQIEEMLLELEKLHMQFQDKINEVLSSAAALTSLPSSSYVKERSQRLIKVLQSFQEKKGYDPRSFHPLYRQIEKIKDQLLSDYFSPSIDRMLHSIQKKDEMKMGFITYQLDGVYFGIRGSIVNTPERIDIKFPSREDSSFFKDKEKRNYIYVQSNSSIIYALQYDDHYKIVENKEKLKLNPLEVKHSIIKGWIKLEGKKIYIIE